MIADMEINFGPIHGVVSSAGLAVFLPGPMASAPTAAAIPIDGGWTAL